MRIISGTLKGILIQPPKGLPVRPTTDRAKESLFNILENNFDWEGMDVLDLFSGTGNMAYECCSRGAQAVTSVDLDFKCVAFIKSMKEKHSLQNLSVVKRDAFTFIKNCTDTFDFIFADAPYAHKQLYEIPRLIMEHGLLRKTGWLVVEHESHLDLNNEIGFFDKRIYGQSAFSFFKHL